MTGQKDMCRVWAFPDDISKNTEERDTNPDDEFVVSVKSCVVKVEYKCGCTCLCGREKKDEPDKPPLPPSPA